MEEFIETRCFFVHLRIGGKLTCLYDRNSTILEGRQNCCFHCKLNRICEKSHILWAKVCINQMFTTEVVADSHVQTSTAKQWQKSDWRRGNWLAKIIYINIFSQKLCKAGDFWRKQEYTRYAFKTGASRSKRKSWNICISNTLQGSRDECSPYECSGADEPIQFSKSRNIAQKVVERRFWIIIPHTHNDLSCVIELNFPSL